MQYGNVHVRSIYSDFLAGIVNVQGKRRGRVTYNTGGGYNIGASVAEVYVKSCNCISSRSAVLRSNAQGDVYTGRDKDKRGSSAIYEIIDQQIIIGIYVHGWGCTVVDHLNTSYRRGRKRQNRSVIEHGIQAKGRCATQETTGSYPERSPCQSGKVRLVGLYDRITTCRLNIEIIHPWIYAEVGRESAVSQVGHNFASGTHHHIHSGGVRRTMQNVELHFIRIRG